MIAFQIILLLIFPYLTIYLHQSGKIPHWLSPVILCYGIGILLANLPFLELHHGTSDYASQTSILLAIPLLLFSTDLVAWFKLAGTTLLAFLLCVLSGLVCSFLAAFFLQDVFEQTALMSGMLVGIYTGGIPNLNAIGLAKEAPSDLILYMNGADMMIGGIYFLFLTAIAPYLFEKILPKFKAPQTSNSTSYLEEKKASFSIKDTAIGLLLSILIILFAVGLVYGITGELQSVSGIILLLTLLSIIASFSLKIRQLRGAFELGEYLILVFCIALGMLADFSQILQEGGTAIMYTFIVLSTTVSVHLLLCWWFKIDRDTMLITSTAALYGPPFIAQIAQVIDNKKLIFSGIVTGLVGYAIGNFLGIGMIDLLNYLGW